MAKKPKILIIGAGFGGIKLVKALRKESVEVCLVDRNNYHNFQPLMYQVATGGLEPGSIAHPVRRIFKNYKNFSFRMADVFEVDIPKNQISSSLGDMKFDYLIIASGSKNSYFNFEPVKDKLLTLKSLPEALQMRNRIFQNLEHALANNRIEPLEEIMNIAIVGGGPAGLELAGALAEMKKFVIPKEFPELDRSKMSINLYEAGAELLGAMSEEASKKSLEYLEEMGVNVFLNSRVKNYDGTTIELADGTSFTTNTVIWSAGVQGSPIKGMPETAIVKGNRISVNEFNQVTGSHNIFAIGDVSANITTENPKGLSMLAPVAQQQAEHLAKNIMRIIANEPLLPFEYHNKGVMATIGRRKAVVDLPNFKFQGGFAWLVWMFVHIFSLVGFRDKAVTFLDWMSNYLSYDRPLGLILIADNHNEVKPEKEDIKKEKVEV